MVKNADFQRNGSSLDCLAMREVSVSPCGFGSRNLTTL
ncbi:MAG: hypothetical protein OJF48_002058 [Afipia sp.]|nr:MAG: hypothetical protein OJF48_002058 [Afipia sp.]